MNTDLISVREGCGEGVTPAPEGEHSQELMPPPPQPVGLWSSALGVVGSAGIGLQRPTGASTNPDEPNGYVWPWMNPAGVHCGNLAARRLAVAEWIDLEMALAAGRYQTDGTEKAKAALAALAGATPSSIPDGLWPAGSRMGARDVVVAWWRYLTFRWEAFGEYPEPATQLAQLHLLSTWRNPHDCIRQSIAGSFKGIYPLRADIDSDLYRTHAPIIVRASRKLRTPHHDGATVRDTVRSYQLRPDWAERLQDLSTPLPAAILHERELQRAQA